MIKFKSAIIENEKITSEAVLTYIGLMYMCEGKIQRLFTSISAIEIAIQDSFEFGDRYFKDKIKRGLANLLENNIIQIKSQKEDLKPNDAIEVYIIDFNLNSEIKSINFHKIIKYARDFKKFEVEKLLRYYLVCVINIDRVEMVGTKTILELSELAFISDWIAKSKYNKILEQLEIIYICRNNSGNVYGEYCNKELIEDWYNNNKYMLDNPSIEKIKQICRNSINEWKNSVEKVCCITQSKNDIEIHHSKSFQIILYEAINELGINIDEADVIDILKIQELVIEKHKEVKPIPITHSLHKELHRIYGHCTTSEETYEFIENKKRELNNR